MPHHKSAASCGEYIPKGINAAVIATQAAGQPVISIDTKKKEPIGSYKNGGSDYRQEGCPDKVNVHDFVDKELGKVAPGACPRAVMSVFKGSGHKIPPRFVF